MVISQLILSLTGNCRLEHSLPTIVGVSGGPDSLCLMDALHRLEWKIIVACYNHHLRPESDKEVHFVQKAAFERDLLFIEGGSNVREIAENEKVSLEEAARISRYLFLFQQARNLNAQAVAVAHTADDQVETVLMHFLRGAGLSGLTGMAYRTVLAEWDRELPLVRPFLGVWREEVMDYCRDNGLQPIIDSSNEETIYLRNRLRHELIPSLQSYNPGIKQTIWRMAQNLEGDYADLELIMASQENVCLLEIGENFSILSYPKVKGLSPGMQRNLLRRVTARLHPGLRDIDFEAVERALEFIRVPSRSHRMEWVCGFGLTLEGEKLVISDPGWQGFSGDLPQMKTLSTAMDVPGQIQMDNDWVLRSWYYFENDEVGTHIQKDPFIARLDAEMLTLPLQVRTLLPGDRFKPLGLDGHSVKLSDFFINEHLTRAARKRWPILVSGDEITWIPGFRIAHPFRVTDQTQRIIELKLGKEITQS